MKQIIIVIIGIIAIIAVSLYANIYLKTSAQNIAPHINNIGIYSQRQDWNSASKEMKLLESKWSSVKSVWSMLIEHQEIDNVEVSMDRVSKYVESKNSSDALAESASLGLFIEHIPETYELNLGNIF